MPALEILTSEYVRQLLSSMRTEAAVNQISRIVNTGTVVRINSYPEERNRRDFSNTTPRLSDARLFQFTRSYSTSMTSQIQGMISDNDLYKVVLHRELGRIEKLLGRLTSSWDKNPPKGIVHIPPLITTWNLHIPPISDTISHQNLVVDAFQLQSLIDCADVFDIGYAICSLGTKLGNLGMIEDNLTLTLWTVDFWKKITSLSPTINLNAWAYLAHELTNASMCYSNIGDKTEAYAKSQEAIDIITRKLYCNREAQTLLAINLSTQAKNTTTLASMNDIELATQAVFTLEKALSLQKEQLAVDSQPIPLIVSSDSLHDSLYCYSRILLILSYTQQSHGYISDAHATHKRALSILHSLLREYPMSRRLLAKTAMCIGRASPLQSYSLRFQFHFRKYSIRRRGHRKI